MRPAVLLISPGILKWTDMDFGLPHLVSIGGYLRQHVDVRVEILDLNYEGGDHRTLQRTLEGLGPYLLIGVSSYSSFDYPRVMALARFLKGLYPDVPLIAGGYHASALPEDLVFYGSPFDAVVLGEGERPVLEMVQTLLGGGRLEKSRWGPDLVQELDTLPPYAWDLLDRYWPRSRDIGRKLQVYLSRGCPYHCTFCMERSKSGYQWRAYSPDRALEELRRLSKITDLGHWVVNLADPLFGFHRRWRRQVLEGIIREDLLPRQYWTLTRSDDLDEEDVALLARARFSIGIGLESGSPRMLQTMQKGNHPQAYLDAMRRLSRLSRDHGLNWAANIIVGHPGESPESLRETHAFVTELFTTARDTCGWVSIDPFRLYPGSQVAETTAEWSAKHGAVFHHPTWWKSWYDHAFKAQHIEPSSDLSYEERVRFMVEAYGPLVAEVQRRFRGQGRSIDRVYARSMDEQRKMLSPENAELLIARGRRVRSEAEDASAATVSVPIGLNQKDPWVRTREEAIRALLASGVLRTSALIEAFLSIGPEGYMSGEQARQVLAGRVAEVGDEGAVPAGLDLRTTAMMLEALEPGLGDTVADGAAGSGWVAAILAELVGPEGRVLVVSPADRRAQVARSLAHLPQVALVSDLGALARSDEDLDGLVIGAAMPRFPKALKARLHEPGGRAVTFLGPRFRPQDLVALTRHGDTLEERTVARRQVPVLGGPWGWTGVRPPRAPAPADLHLDRWPAPALLYEVLAHLDVGDDAASLHDGRTAPWAAALSRSWRASPRRLVLHGLGLRHRLIPSLLAALRSFGGSPADEALGTALAEVVEAEAPAFLERWVADREAAAARRDRVRLALSPLGPLRAWLWAQQERPAPPLRVLDCPALGRAGRAGTVGEERVVAVSLGQDPGWVLCQILHEEVHPITDPIVRAEHGGSRDTRRGSEGWAVHEALERVAIAATGALLEARAPELSPLLARWEAGIRL